MSFGTANRLSTLSANKFRIYSVCLCFLLAVFLLSLTLLTSSPEDRPYVNVVTVACGGSRFGQALNLVKSILISTDRHADPVALYVVTDEETYLRRAELEATFTALKDSAAFSAKPVSLQVLQSDFSEAGSQSKACKWQYMWRPCATQRLFLPGLLKYEDAAIYVDTDTLFLASVHELWRHFALMNSSQIMGMAPEHEPGSVQFAGPAHRHLAHYLKKSRVPYAPPLGLNSGVLLMNLTRMRLGHYTPKLMTIYEKYEADIRLHDQDILNIRFHFHPDELYVLPCAWNYRAHHCVEDMSNCDSAAEHGIFLLHGNTGDNGDSIFKTAEYGQVQFPIISGAIEKYDPAHDFETAFRRPLAAELAATNASNSCKSFYTHYVERIRVAPFLKRHTRLAELDHNSSLASTGTF